MGQNFSIESLTSNDNNLWRIDWFGYLEYKDKYGQRRSTPQVEVFLSKLNEAPVGKKVNFKSASDYKNQVKVPVPVEYLSILRIGHIWQKGKLVATPAYQPCYISRHYIDPNSTETRFASHKNENDNYLIPFEYHPYHQKAVKTHCEVITLSNGRNIVFPHWVILQAYFSKCSFVFSELMQFGPQYETLFNPEKSSLIDGNGIIRLRKNVRNIAGPEVARIAWDKTALRAVSMISENLALKKSQNHYLSPKTQFPFSAVTSLKLKGKYVPNGSHPDSFIVYEILKCDAPFPFTSLDIIRDNPGQSNQPDKNQPHAHSKPNSPRNNEPPTDNLPLDPGEEPNKDFRIYEFSLDLGMEYGDLENKNVDTVVQEGEGQQRYNYKEAPEGIEIGNTGKGNTTGDASPVHISSSEGDSDKDESKEDFVFDFEICRLKIFRDALLALVIDKQIDQVSFIVVNGQFVDTNEGSYSYFPKTYTSSRSERKWRYISYSKGTDFPKFILRRALIARIQFNRNSIYLLEVERRLVTSESGQGWVEKDHPGLLSIKSNIAHNLPVETLKDIMHQGALNSGVWLSDKLTMNNLLNPLGFSSRIINHPSNQKAFDTKGHKQLLKNSILNGISK